jgi:hemoglobin-like flavoprotein
MMELTKEQKQIVQQTFTQVAVDSDSVAALFYDRLFTLDPTLRRMFPEDMSDQRAKLIQTLWVAIRSLHNPEVLAPTVRALGERHVSYGVKAEHYATVGSALLWTLERGLKDDFTPEVRAAWTAVYYFLANTAMGNLYPNNPSKV